ncbi:MAG TPA: cupin domain-containing protein [Stellaceae bacterium]|jgi:quercetin dioxygenase-like cupin family protein|nr:cupin domain-containing protein [Stellaceae bacterium]
MTVKVRRVVTGHDAEGRAIVAIDDMPTNVVSRRPGHSSLVIWNNATTPGDNQEEGDQGRRDVGACAENGTFFRVIEYQPGVASRMHRTETIDYAVVMSGEIEMGLDDGVSVHLKAGDVIVQRGTIHDWTNNGTEPCVIAFVMTAAKPVETKAGALGAHG